MQTKSKHEIFSTALSDFAVEMMQQYSHTMLHMIRRAGLSMPQFVTMMYLSGKEAATVSDISQHLNLSLGATSHLVDRLVVDQYVSRVEDREDRRHKQIALTEAGAAFVAEVKQTRVAHFIRRFEDLPPEQLQAAAQVLRGLTEHLRATENRSDRTCPSSARVLSNT